MHLHNVEKQQDQIVIKCRDSNGDPFEVVHDFNFAGGQGYERNYSGPLASDYVMADCEDANGFNRCYYGGPDGKIYRGQEGWNDAGAEYSADYVGLQNLGPNRPSICDVQLWGDSDILNQEVFSWRTDLDGSRDWNVCQPAQNPGEESDVRFHHRFSSGSLHMFYYRFQMNSHSADAPTTELSDPPHLPLETYGKIYMARALYSDSPEGTI